MKYLEKNKERIEKKFTQRIMEFKDFSDSIKEVIETLDENTALSLKYLYATMPISDIGNYPVRVYEDYARCSTKLYEENEEVRKLSEEMFLNYILYHRANEEEIAPCRTLFNKLLGTFLEGKEGLVKALEVNYWCAKEASYRASDDRTASALSVYQKGHGRCGEESVFAVNAYRSVGIPARQVYAPKWSHCDDNHAWVEIYVEDKWQYLGACEPEPILNKGWFTHAAARGMMIHSRWFDEVLPEKEELVEKEGMVSLFNQLGRYGDTVTIKIKAEDEAGEPLVGIKIYCEVLNYGNFSPIAILETNENAEATLRTGKGSLYLSFVHENTPVVKLIDTSKNEREFTINKGRDRAVLNQYVDIDFMAPSDEGAKVSLVSKEEQELNKERLISFGHIRENKIDQYENPEIAKFLAEENKGKKWKIRLLNILSKKDREDVSEEVLRDAYYFGMVYKKEWDKELFLSYVLNPRIADEVLSPFREEILDLLTKEEKEQFKRNPAAILSYIKQNITPRPSEERASVLTKPASAMRLKVASKESGGILFVAIARTLGIPARLHPTTKVPQYFKTGRFHTVEERNQQIGSLFLEGLSRGDWKDTINYGLAKMEEENFVVLHPENGNHKKESISLLTGTYRLITTNRLPNGNQAAKVIYFEILENQETKIKLDLRSVDLDEMLTKIELEDFTIHKEKEITYKEIAGDKAHIIMWLDPGKEPTEHILNELMELSSAYNQVADQVSFVLFDKTQLDNKTLTKAREQLPKIQIYFSSSLELVEKLGRRMYVDFEKRPFILVSDAKGRGVFGASGYQVGMGNLLLNILKYTEI